MLRMVYLMMGVILSAQGAFCATDSSNQELALALKDSSSEPSGFMIIFSLLFVIALIYLTGVIYSKLNVVGANTVRKQLKDYDLSKASVLSTTQLGQNKNLHVVELNKKRFLIGATQNSINLIRELDVNEDDLQVLEDAANVDTEPQEAEEVFDLHKKYL